MAGMHLQKCTCRSFVVNVHHNKHHVIFCVDQPGVNESCPITDSPSSTTLLIAPHSSCPPDSQHMIPIRKARCLSRMNRCFRLCYHSMQISGQIFGYLPVHLRLCMFNTMIVGLFPMIVGLLNKSNFDSILFDACVRAGHNYDSIGATDGGFAVATIGSGFPSSPWVIDHRRVQVCMFGLVPRTQGFCS